MHRGSKNPLIKTWPSSKPRVISTCNAEVVSDVVLKYEVSNRSSQTMVIIMDIAAS